MSAYRQINLLELLNEYDLSFVQSMLDNFACPVNADIERFLRQRAVEFARQGIAQTHLVFSAESSGALLVGFFSLANKVLSVRQDEVSKTLFKKLQKHGLHDESTGTVHIAMPLIAQLGKNYTNNCDLLIAGDTLLEMACSKVSAIQRDLGGKMTYLECENTPALTSFYEHNGFKCINPSGGTGELLQFMRRS